MYPRQVAPIKQQNNKKVVRGRMPFWCCRTSVRKGKTFYFFSSSFLKSISQDWSSFYVYTLPQSCGKVNTRLW